VFTDYFDQPIAVGDEVVWPTGTYNNPHALTRGPVIAIVPLVPHRTSKTNFMRADQAGRQYPTYYPKPPSDDKAYILKVRGKDWRGQDKTVTVRTAANVIKVPAGA
jgi:hypothetical protein